MDGSGDWADAYKRAQSFVRGLTLTEKVNLTTGVRKFKVISASAILT
jgi:beta-glucosidase